MNRAKRFATLLVSASLGIAIAAYVAVCAMPPNSLDVARRAEAADSQHAKLVLQSTVQPTASVERHEPVQEAMQPALAAQVTLAETAPISAASDNVSAEIADETSPSLDEESESASGGSPDAPDSDSTSPQAEPAAKKEELPAAASAILEAIRLMQTSGRPGAASSDEPSEASTLSVMQPPVASEPAPTIGEPLPEPSKVDIGPAPGEGDDLLRVYIKDEDLRVVLAALSEQGGLNILPSKNVQGTVSASLNNVTVETALDAILRSTGYVARREGPFIYVGTPLDFNVMAHTLDAIGTRVYRPNYVSAQELVALITPVLTPAPVGKIVASSPSKTDIPSDDIKAGGNDFASADAVLVQDYEAVLAAVDQLVAEIDARPPQVAIKAMILSVRLNDTNQFGIDFQFLRNKQHLRFATGSPMTDLAQVTFNNGLKFAFLDSNLGAFLDALETIGDTNVVARPNLMVLNKQRAEILIGSELGYVSTSQTETSTTQSVNFLEVGAQLRLRPFIAEDGMIRMEIHPELSQGSVRVEGGFTLPDKEVTKVTTNIMVRDGYTIVIGGLMREDLTTTTSQIPVVGNLPLVGFLFRNKNEEIEKREILVLVTPHIVREPDVYYEGEQGAGEFFRRHDVYQDKMSPLGKRALGRKYFRLAQEAWQRDDRKEALKLVSLSIQFDPLSRAAIDLRSDIWAGIHSGDHSGGTDSQLPIDPPMPIDSRAAIEPNPPTSGDISPWILDELEQSAEPAETVPPGSSRAIDSPAIQPLRRAP
jgi:type IV pilus assembly protein PilQ